MLWCLVRLFTEVLSRGLYANPHAAAAADDDDNSNNNNNNNNNNNECISRAPFHVKQMQIKKRGDLVVGKNVM